MFNYIRKNFKVTLNLNSLTLNNMLILSYVKFFLVFTLRNLLDFNVVSHYYNNLLLKTMKIYFSCQ